MSEKKFKVIRVTIEEDFIIEMIDDKRTNINGWTVDEIIDDWFIRHGMSHHATRDSRRLGGSRKYIKHQLIDLDKSIR